MGGVRDANPSCLSLDNENEALLRNTHRWKCTCCPKLKLHFSPHPAALLARMVEKRCLVIQISQVCEKSPSNCNHWQQLWNDHKASALRQKRNLTLTVSHQKPHRFPVMRLFPPFLFIHLLNLWWLKAVRIWGVGGAELLPTHAHQRPHHQSQPSVLHGPADDDVHIQPWDNT